MKNRVKRAVSAVITLAVMGGVALTNFNVANATDTETKVVDGSALTMEESASGKSIESEERGYYILVGECSITKAGRGRIYVYASTTGARTVNFLSTTAYVDAYNEKDDAWDQIYAWSEDAENNYFVMTSKYLTVDSGYYYRVRADHFAGMEFPYEETYSFTDGILVN